MMQFIMSHFRAENLKQCFWENLKKNILLQFTFQRIFYNENPIDGKGFLRAFTSINFGILLYEMPKKIRIYGLSVW